MAEPQYSCLVEDGQIFHYDQRLSDFLPMSNELPGALHLLHLKIQQSWDLGSQIQASRVGEDFSTPRISTNDNFYIDSDLPEYLRDSGTDRVSNSNKGLLYIQGVQAGYRRHWVKRRYGCYAF